MVDEPTRTLPIRWKLLILLLVMAVLPLVFLTGLANRTTRRMGEELAARAREAMTEQLRRRLVLFVQGQAEMLGKDGRIVELVVELQAREVERCLANEPAAEGPLLFSRDYESTPDHISGLHPSARHLPLSADGRQQPIPITFDHQVFVTAPGVDRAKVESDASRLKPMTSWYRQAYENHEDLFYWMYTSLENGLHSCFPGHGGYPEAYDPRERDWYKLATQFGGSDETVWTAPYIEVSTGQSVLTAMKAVHRPDGSLAGVTAVDVMVSDVVARSRIPRVSSAVPFMVVLLPRDVRVGKQRLTEEEVRAFDDEPEKLGMLVLARPVTDEAGDADWQASPEPEWLAGEDPEAALEMIRDMVAGRGGVRDMPYRGEPALWAYGPLMPGDRTFLVVVAPQDEIIREAQKAEAMVRDRFWSQLKLTAAGTLVLIAIIVVVALVGSRAITRPVDKLAETARRIADGDLEARASIRTRDELEELSRAFDDMVPQLADRMKIRQSLSLAMEVQQSLLPTTAPKVPGLEVAGRSIYCDETGGDYYDYLDVSKLTSTELGIAVGDVTGHGVAAALLMTSARALMRTRAGQIGSIASLMAELNGHLTADTPVGRFMTLFYMVIDATERSVRWASAGHDAAEVYDPRHDRFKELAGSDIPLGIEMEWEFREYERADLEPGQIIVIGTDGIWESRNPQGELFGKEPLREIIRANASRPVDEISQAITETLAEFRGGRAQEDDVTLVVVRIAGDGKAEC